ncbi:sodium-coupled monocarboxylate transporter 2-like isoform X2 [Tenebrio molitor]
MSLLCEAIGMCLIVTSSVFLGLTIYARYADCDPLLNHKITKNDELVSYYVMDIAGNIPGLSGLFMAAMVSAAISTISSSLNSISGVIYKDYISKFSRRQFTEKSAVFILKLIVVIEGVLSTSLVLIIEHLGQVVPLSISLSGMVNGPLLGLFTLGVLFPKINAKSAFYGGICGLICISFIALPAYYYKYHHLFVFPTKSFSVEGCLLNLSIANTSNILFGVNSSTPVTFGTNDTLNTSTWKPFFLFRISYYYYCLIGAVATIITALIINRVVNRNGSSAKRVLISPVCHFLLPEVAEPDAQALETFIKARKDEEN